MSSPDQATRVTLADPTALGWALLDALLPGDPTVDALRRPTGWVPTAAAEALLAYYEAELRRQDEQGAERYDHALEAPFDAVAAGESVPYRALPLGLQQRVGGMATAYWYAPPVDPTVYGWPEPVTCLATSTWTRREVRARELAPAVLSPWAVAHLWAPAAAGIGRLGVDWARVLDAGDADAPVILFDGQLHRACVPYLIAVLRAAPDRALRVLEGRTTPAAYASMAPPAAPMTAWNAAGTRLRERDELAPVGERIADVLRADHVRRQGVRRAQAGHSAAVDGLWTAHGLPDAGPLTLRPEEYALPYDGLRAPGPSGAPRTVAEQLAWTAPAAAGAASGEGTLALYADRPPLPPLSGVGRLVDWVLNWLEGWRERTDARRPFARCSAVGRVARASVTVGAHEAIARLRVRRITAYFPEIRRALAVATTALGTPRYPSEAVAWEVLAATGMPSRPAATPAPQAPSSSVAA